MYSMWCARLWICDSLIHGSVSFCVRPLLHAGLRTDLNSILTDDDDNGMLCLKTGTPQCYLSLVSLSLCFSFCAYIFCVFRCATPSLVLYRCVCDNFWPICAVLIRTRTNETDLRCLFQIFVIRPLMVCSSFFFFYHCSNAAFCLFCCCRRCCFH